MAKRILWLFNHKSLRKFEVPMLLEMGYEVFCPKIWNLLDFSTDVTYEYDNSLTIPKDVLDRLNKVDFYQSIPEDVMRDLNEYFDIAICMLVHDMLDSLAKSFTGAIGIHAFGLEKNMSYTAYLGNSLLSLLEQCGNRFWFLPTYDNLSEVECPLLQRRTLFMPIGLSNTTLENTWVGGDKRILFVCPKIKISVYYENVYKEFYDNFGDIPHVIGGAQPIPVLDDKTVTGFLSSEQYEYNMNNLSGMFYHSQEPRHLHYHPLEAIKQGMPVIFMANGMLDHLGGRDLPGRAINIKEAREKINKLLKGDKKFIDSVTKSQIKLLEPFTMSFCRQHWIKGLNKINDSLKLEKSEYKITRKKKIAVVMPSAFKGGVLDYSIRFVLDIQQCIKNYGDNIELVFSYPETDLYDDSIFDSIKKVGVKVRNFTWQVYTDDKVSDMVKLAGYNTDEFEILYYPKYAIMHDGASDFQEFDHVIFTADTATNGLPFFLLKPFTVVAHDYIQRYVPETVSEQIKIAKSINQKSANRILVTSEPMLHDAIQLTGKSKDKIILSPLLLEMIGTNDICAKSEGKGEYFMWCTNASPHKNHLIALKALELYFSTGGNLECYVSGYNSMYLNPKSSLKKAPVDKKYILKIQEFIKRSKYVKKHLHFKGDMDKDAYIETLSLAKFLFHPGFGDNGNGATLDAASLKVPTLSSDYPAMRYLSKFTGIPLLYTSPFSYKKMACDLKNMEENYSIYAENIPNLLELKKCDYREQAENLYRSFKNIIGS